MVSLWKVIPVKLDGDIACDDGVTHAIAGMRREMASGLNTKSVVPNLKSCIKFHIT